MKHTSQIRNLLLITLCTANYIQNLQTIPHSDRYNETNAKSSSSWAPLLAVGGIVAALYAYKTYKDTKTPKSKPTERVEEKPGWLRRGFNWVTSFGKSKQEKPPLEEK